MGQRLVVEIKRSKRRLATVYFHWSAYTKPGVEILNLMYHNVLKNSDKISDNDLILNLIRFAENYTSLGYGDTDEKKYAIQKEVERMINAAPALREFYLTLAMTGGVSSKSLDYASKLFPNESFKQNDISRNAGLVSIQDNDMEECLQWSNGTIEVDLDTKKVVNGLVDEYTIGGYMNEVESYNEDFTDPDLLPRSPIALDEFTLDEIVIVNDVLTIEEESNWIRYDDRIYQTIR